MSPSVNGAACTGNAKLPYPPAALGPPCEQATDVAAINARTAPRAEKWTKRSMDKMMALLLALRRAIAAAARVIGVVNTVFQVTYPLVSSAAGYWTLVRGPTILTKERQCLKGRDSRYVNSF